MKESVEAVTLRLRQEGRTDDYIASYLRGYFSDALFAPPSRPPPASKVSRKKGSAAEGRDTDPGLPG